VTVCEQYGLHAHDIFGHWDFRETQCPGVMFDREFPALRRRVAAGLGTELADIPAPRWADIWKFVGGPVVRLAQYLLEFPGLRRTDQWGLRQRDCRGRAGLAGAQRSGPWTSTPP
jgi:hypothetical protein